MLITAISPCLNEVKYLNKFLDNITCQKLEHELELIIVDGGSTDGSQELLRKYTSDKFYFKFIAHNEKFVSISLNKAILESSGSVIVRLDIHTEYDCNYIKNCVKILQNSSYSCIGGPWRAKSRNFIQKSIRFAFQSKFCSGGALSRDLNYKGIVDTVYLGCWFKNYLLEIGGFDEKLVRNQDDELCHRIRLNGGIIYQDPSIISFYYPRSSFQHLFNQYFQYGFWRLTVLQKSHTKFSLRHVFPPLICFSSLLSFILIIFNIKLFSYVYFTLYFSLVLFSLSKYFLTRNIILIPFTVFAVIIMHHAYGLGFLSSFASFYSGYKYKFSEKITR